MKKARGGWGASGLFHLPLTVILLTGTLPARLYPAPQPRKNFSARAPSVGNSSSAARASETAAAAAAARRAAARHSCYSIPAAHHAGAASALARCIPDSGIAPFHPPNSASSLAIYVWMRVNLRKSVLPVPRN